jgi:hypothetical protein
MALSIKLIMAMELIIFNMSVKILHLAALWNANFIGPSRLQDGGF